MGEKVASSLNHMLEALREGPLSISDISKKAQINWRTADQYLKLLESLGLVTEKSVKNTKTFLLKEKENYFGLPVKKEHHNKINAIYSAIKKHCLEFYSRAPTKTQAYKTLWKVDKKLNLGLPIGWYLYGPLCVQTYAGNETSSETLSWEEHGLIKDTVEEFCKCDNFELQNKIYDDTNNKLYQTKEKLVKINYSDKETINPVLMDLVKFAPPETLDVVTDFARTVLMLGWEKTRACFEWVWKYVSLVSYKESLQFYYGEATDVYFEDRIKDAKKKRKSTLFALSVVILNKFREDYFNKFFIPFVIPYVPCC